MTSNISNLVCGVGFVCIHSNLWEEVGDLSHFAWGAIVVLLPVVLFRRWIHPKWVMLVVDILFVVYALVKEEWYDEIYEIPVERGRDWEDIITYLSGLLLGNLASIAVFPAYDRIPPPSFQALKDAELYGPVST